MAGRSLSEVAFTVRRMSQQPFRAESSAGATAALLADVPAAELVENELIEPRHPASLSPSRASDFLTCPLLYRFRVIDRLPQRPSPAATRGTVVHSVLERLFDLPAAERTPEKASTMAPRVGPAARRGARGRRAVRRRRR